MLLLNFTGQPGAGKSTIAAGVFHILKKRKWNAELITEYTKELIMQEDYWSLNDELIVFTEKYIRIKRMKNVDLVVTDSPLINSMVYGKEQYSESGSKFFYDISLKFDSLYFVVEPKTEYIPFGRMPDENKAVEAGKEIISILDNIPHPVYKIEGNDSGMNKAVDIIEQEARKRKYVTF